MFVKRFVVVAALFVAACAGAKDDIRAICDDPLTTSVERLCEEYVR